MSDNPESTPIGKIKAAFLDRDGVINRDKNYVYKICDFEFMPDAVAGLRLLQTLGYALVVVTNQSGIGRGYFSEQAYQRFSDHMVSQLASEGIELAGVYFCPHLPQESSVAGRCRCRKPAPGMIVDAARDLDVELAQSIMIGDKSSDVEAGYAAGIDRCFLIWQANADTPVTAKHPLRFASLLSLARYLCVTDAQQLD